jgi:aminopeptidase-like protein
MQTVMKQYFNKLWPLNRSITGEDYRRSLDILNELVPMDYLDIRSGTLCHNWTVPDEWNCHNAYIIAPNGDTICDFKLNNLHVVGYSTPIDSQLTWGELKPHIHTVKENWDAVPYITSYYKRTWGFCMEHSTFMLLDEKYEDDDIFEVYIDSTIQSGIVRLGQAMIPGKTADTILLSTYLCHPSMANNELSGPLVWAMTWHIQLVERIPRTADYTVQLQ